MKSAENNHEKFFNDLLEKVNSDSKKKVELRALDKHKWKATENRHKPVVSDIQEDDIEEEMEENEEEEPPD